MGLLAYLIAFLIGAAIIGFIFLCIHYLEFFAITLVVLLLALAAFVIGIPIADLLGVRP